MRARLVLYSLAGAVVFAGCVERKTAGPDAAEPAGDGAPSGSEVPAVVPTPDGPIPDVTVAPDLSSGDTTDVPLLGTGGAGGAGVDGSSEAGVPGSGGGSGTTGGASGSGGAVGSGGALATGGVVGSGGAVGTGGTTTCQPKPRDCTSSLDNNCNVIPDNQETSYCECPVGNSRACEEHPGYDGKGICKAGSQTCAASGDKTTSRWGDCSGAVAPGTEVCEATGLDENCNNQSNEGCECVNGTPVPCECGPATTCVNGKKGTCAGKVTLYLDSDRDGSGNPARPGLVCLGTPDYVSNADDCDDGDGTFKPGVSICSTDASQRRSCAAGGGGVAATDDCPHGCLNGI